MNSDFLYLRSVPKLLHCADVLLQLVLEQLVFPRQGPDSALKLLLALLVLPVGLGELLSGGDQGVGLFLELLLQNPTLVLWKRNGDENMM